MPTRCQRGTLSWFMMQPQLQEAQGSSPPVSPPTSPSFPLSPSPQLGQQQLPDTADQELLSGSSLQGAGPASSPGIDKLQGLHGNRGPLGHSRCLNQCRGGADSRLLFRVGLLTCSRTGDLPCVSV